MNPDFDIKPSFSPVTVPISPASAILRNPYK
nr:MAG TPA: hypothetical protein [Bacteriophage sp.]